MSLTDQQREEIRNEEYFRSEVRRELADRKPPPTFYDHVAKFFETKAGFWLLTSVLAGLVATGYASMQKYLDRDEITRREAIQRSQRDLETLLKLGPMLTSDKRTQIDMAILLLDSLASDNALEPRFAAQIRALVQGTLAAGLRSNASAQEKEQAEAIIAYADKARVDAIQEPEATTQAALPVQTAAATVLDKAVLPARVYIQIAGEEDRTRAETARTALRKAGLVVPGIEVVPVNSVPAVSDFRYCESKVDTGILERVALAVNATVVPSPKMVVLPARLCGNVRQNHFELWLARRQ